MARIDLYRNVHKGQRVALFDLASELGRADPADRTSLSALAARLQGMLVELRQHAINEETYIHPLLQQYAPEVAVLLESEHRRLDPALTEIENRLRDLATAEDRPAAVMELYRSWCRMVSAYLEHLDKEERLAMPALWRSCTDEEIFAVIRRFLASRTTDDLLDDLRSQAPALAPQERTAYVGAMVHGGAVPAEQVWKSLNQVLPVPLLSRLREDLASRPG
jgi:iron-sulfur cluster repair protein YtfE (RIC family)